VLQATVWQLCTCTYTFFNGQAVLAWKKVAPKNFANISRFIEIYHKILRTIAYSLILKSGNIHSIIYRIDKITLLLVMET